MNRKTLKVFCSNLCLGKEKLVELHLFVNNFDDSWKKCCFQSCVKEYSGAEKLII